MIKIKTRFRKKFTSVRKKKYFEVQPKVFHPLISYLKKKFKKKRKIAISIYYPSNFEFNILKIYENKRFKKFLTLLPVVKKNNQMEFLKWNKKDILKVNKYGMLEPIYSKKTYVPDIMIVPLIAFDKTKTRLGYGKGYYDRFLSTYLKKNKKIDSIGIGFTFQRHKKLPYANHDVRLNKIFTERGFLK